MQFLGSASTAHNPEIDMPAADGMIDVGGPWTAAAASPVGDETVAAAPEKESYFPATGGALGTKMDKDASPFEVDIGGGGSYEDVIASGVNEFFDVFRALDDGADGFPEGGLNAADQGMEVDDDEFAWLNSPDAFMPLPIADIPITDLPIGDIGGLGQAPAMVVTTGEEIGENEEEGMGPGVGDDNMEDMAGAPLAAGWPVPEATPEAAPAPAVAVAAATMIWPPAAAAAVAATTILPPVALEGGDTAEAPGIGGGQYADTPAPAYDFGGGGGGGGGAGYMFAGGPSGDAVGVGVAAAEAMAVAPTATNMIAVNGAGGGSSGGGGGGHAGGLSPKELIRRQKVERYLAKKKRRRWTRASSYQSRQRVANNRPRHKGRFLPLVSDFVPISELKRRQRALMAQQAVEQEEKQTPLPSQEAPTTAWGASAQFPGCGDYGQGEG